MKIITVYSKKPCVQCTAVMRWLDKRAIPYEIADATTPENIEALKALNYATAPVTIVNDGTGDVHFGGFNPDLLAEFCTPKEAAA